MTDRETPRTAPLVVGGFSFGIIAAAAAVALTILALLSVEPTTLTAIAAIAIGSGLLFEGAAVASRWTTLEERVATDLNDEAILGGGLSAEVIAGVAGIVLGILALLAVIPHVLLAASAIGFGGALVLGSDTEQQLVPLDDEAPSTEAMRAPAGGELLVGLAAVALGILALALGNPTLTITAMLTVGGGMVLGGSTLLARMGAAITH
jgi:hypothetical protein